ncbi:Uncharacterised protein [Streptococcus pneumoniae]|nr:Uncharacterised protein [Streptococcus pneumoniae]
MVGIAKSFWIKSAKRTVVSLILNLLLLAVTLIKWGANSCISCKAEIMLPLPTAGFGGNTSNESDGVWRDICNNLF